MRLQHGAEVGREREACGRGEGKIEREKRAKLTDDGENGNSV